jgi:hypothetical protein
MEAAERRRCVAELHPLHSQLEIALILGVGPTTVARDEKELGLERERGRPADAASRPGENVKARLRARTAAQRRARLARDRRSAERYRSDPTLTLEQLGRDLGVSATQAMRILDRAGVPRRPTGRRRGVAAGPMSEETRAKIGTRKRQWYATPAGATQRSEASTRLSDPVEQSTMRIRRWGVHGVKAARAVVLQLQRRRSGGRPPSTALHNRWVAMYEGGDAELEELLVGSELTRFRAIAWLDWQRHPEDWPRERYPASRTDADDADPKSLRPMERRLRDALRARGIKPLQTAYGKLKAA